MFVCILFFHCCVLLSSCLLAFICILNLHYREIVNETTSQAARSKAEIVHLMFNEVEGIYCRYLQSYVWVQSFKVSIEKPCRQVVSSGSCEFLSLEGLLLRWWAPNLFSLSDRIFILYSTYTSTILSRKCID